MEYIINNMDSDEDSDESSSDPSFRLENHRGGSDDSDGSDIEVSVNDDDDENSSEDDELATAAKQDKDDLEPQPGTSKDAALSTQQLIDQSQAQTTEVVPKIHAKPVCCVCLGDRSGNLNEIVECDGCKVTVHKGCYGESKSIIVSSTSSSCSTEPWFCEACIANVKKPDCELCPNKGGIFKGTNTGRWVHLVCALYVLEVQFGELDQLSNVTLFEMQYNKWGSKKCSLCDDAKFAWTGVCIGCDVGMCKTIFHATCAQRAGFLSEARHEDVDPYLAHCKMHTDNTEIKTRQRKFNTLLMQSKRNEIELAKSLENMSPEVERIQRKLAKHRTKYASNKVIRPKPWVPTQKMPRKMASSALACRKLSRKSDLMGIDTKALEFEALQIAQVRDIRKKWYVSPAFSTEFVAYYLDRTSRLTEMKDNLLKQSELHQLHKSQQDALGPQYDELARVKDEVLEKQRDLVTKINSIHEAIQKIMPNKQLRSIEMIGRILSTQKSVNNAELMNECGICKKCTDQHVLVKCGQCKLYYHLGCLNPPLLRMPKESKNYAWQCSKCVESDDSEPENEIIPKGQRKSRIRDSSSVAHHKLKTRETHKRRHSKLPSEGGDATAKKRKQKRK